MTKSIAELEADLDAAETAVQDARAAAREALGALVNAKADALLADLAEKGITPGTKVLVKRHSGDPVTLGFAGVRPSYLGSRAVEMHFVKIKRDGTPGMQASKVWTVDINEVEPAE